MQTFDHLEDPEFLSIDSFLFSQDLSQQKRTIFMRRYWKLIQVIVITSV